jgi:hypothetical protein
VWPVALAERIAPREEASSWYRFQMHQALWFGVIATAMGCVALAWPLFASLATSDAAVTIWIYALAFILDCGGFIVWLVLAVRYSRRAERGELFDVPWVARLTGARSQKR